MFALFHHFHPEAAQSNLRDAFQNRRPICVFEATSRSAPAIATAILIPLPVLLLTPRVRPLSWTQILFTYLLPILPLLIFLGRAGVAAQNLYRGGVERVHQRAGSAWLHVGSRAD